MKQFDTFDDLLIYLGTGPWNILTFCYISASKLKFYL